jgi:two-component system, LytTR family, response regulator LytT
LLSIGLCDDEPDELETLRRFIVDYGNARKESFGVQCFGSGEGLLDALAHGQVFDLLFLDIYMGGSDGVAVARKIREQDKTCGIVFVTNSRDHAINAYGVSALHYLLKPVAAEDVASTLDLAMEALKARLGQCAQVQNKQGSYRILLDDIVYAESRARVVIIHTRKHGNISYYDSLDGFQGQCDDARFLRCHKSFLVNLDFVHSISENCFLLTTDEEIRISMRVSEAKEIFAAHLAERI